MGVIKNDADKNFIKVTLFKAVPLFVLAFIATMLLKYIIVPYLGLNVSEWWYPAILLIFASVIGNKIMRPAKLAVLKERARKNQ